MADIQNEQDEREPSAPASQPANEGASSQEPAEGGDDVAAPTEGSPRG